MSKTLVAMAGLPGTGKSTIARGIAESTGAAVLGKDPVRAALFGSFVDYSDAQDDLTVGLLLQAAGYLLESRPDVPVILDGRTFTRLHQLAVVKAAAVDLGARLMVIECVCPPGAALARLQDADHPAADRTPDLYRRLAEDAEELPPPKLIVDTGNAAVEECVAQAVEYLNS